MTMLMGCTSYRYEYIPPQTEEGKLCIQQCMNRKWNCTERCQSSKANCISSAISKNDSIANLTLNMNNINTSNVNTHGMNTSNINASNNTLSSNNLNNFQQQNQTYECDNYYSGCSDNCGNMYDECYKGCGGVINIYEVN